MLLDDVNDMRNANSIGTTTPIYGGGVDYFYVGAYTGGEDAMSDMLDNLLSDTYKNTSGYPDTTGGEDPEIPMQDTTCLYDDCPIVYIDDENESIIVSSEPSTIYNSINKPEYTRDITGDLVVDIIQEPLYIADKTLSIVEVDDPKIFSMKTGDDLKKGGVDKSTNNIKLTDYSKVHEFIVGYTKTLDDKTFKDNS
jgi:hypothetical protein